MKRILITGAGGFIGSHLVEECVRRGFDVKAFVHYNAFSRAGWLEYSKIKSKIDIIFGDIRDYDSVSKAMKDCQEVYHLAALIGIPYSYVTPLAYIKTNVEGTYNVLEAAKQLDLKKVIVTSTSETYGTAQYVPIDEKHPACGQSPYAATKIAADQLAQSYYLSFGLPVKIVRPFNTFGPRQSARAIIPTIICQVLAGKKEINLGNTSPTRDFTYVKDAANGFLEIAVSKDGWGEPVNIGMNEEISVGDLVVLISRLAKKKVKIKKENLRIRPGQSEVERLRCDHTKLIRSTNWKPQYDLESGILETIEFIKNNLSLYKPEIYNV